MNRKITSLFLKVAIPLHRKYQIPCSFFIRGQTLELHTNEFYSLVDDPLFDLEQHTFSHLIFKKITERVNGQTIIHGKDEPLEKIREEIEKTNECFQKLLNYSPIGLTTP